MKPLITALFLVSIWISAEAQVPALDTGNIFNLGDVYTYYFADTTTTTLPRTGGANQIWNFSSVDISDHFDIEYVGAASTPYASAFPNANVATHQGANSWTYFRNNGAQLEILGSTLGTQDTVYSKTIYSDPYILMKAPLTYTDSFQDEFEASYVSNGNTVYTYGNALTVADAWGTFIAPDSKVFHPVLRLHTKSHQTDSLNNGIIKHLIKTNVESYSFMLPGNHNHLLYIAYREVNNDGTIMQGATVYANFDASTISIGKQAALNTTLSVYPNPAPDKVFISVAANGSPSAKVLLYNNLGEVVQTQTLSASSGIITGTVDLSQLPAGLYHVQVQQNGASASRTVIVK